MDTQDFASLKRAMAQVEAYEGGDRKGFVTHEPVDVKAVRAATKKSQQAFAETYHLPVGTVRDWEQGRRQPDAPARALLTIIQADPAVAERLLAKA
ncbi:transcriptional regulator [Sphingobium sp. AN558]|uniref:helix-turn-helix domain-containing protein n=1 Tax=Sphingobium sp. AN558 TaxID=3133442 RepID=UPI0030C0A3F0